MVLSTLFARQFAFILFCIISGIVCYCKRSKNAKGWKEEQVEIEFNALEMYPEPSPVVHAFANKVYDSSPPSSPNDPSLSFSPPNDGRVLAYLL